MPHAKTLEREANVKRVLDVALECFYRDGIEQTKIADIAERAGVTSMSIHRYFGDKATLVINTYKLFWFRFSKDLHAASVEADSIAKDGAGKVSALLRAYVNIYLKDPQIGVWIRNFENYLHNQISAGEAGEDELALIQPLDSMPLLSFIKEGIADGSIRKDIEANALYQAIFAALFGSMLRISETAPVALSNAACDLAKQLSICTEMIENYIRA